MAHMSEEATAINEKTSFAERVKGDGIIGVEITPEDSLQFPNNSEADVRSAVTQLLVDVENLEQCGTPVKPAFTAEETISDLDISENESETGSESDVSDTVIEEALAKAVYSTTFDTAIEAVHFDGNYDMASIAVKEVENFHETSSINSVTVDENHNKNISTCTITESGSTVKQCDEVVDVKPVICHLCGNAYATQENLKNHICIREINHGTLNQVVTPVDTSLTCFGDKGVISLNEPKNPLLKNTLVSTITGGTSDHQKCYSVSKNTQSFNLRHTIRNTAVNHNSATSLKLEPGLQGKGCTVRTHGHKHISGNEQLSVSTANVTKNPVVGTSPAQSVVTAKTKALLAHHIANLKNLKRLHEFSTNAPDKNPLLSLLLGHNANPLKGEKIQILCLPSTMNASVQLDSARKSSTSCSANGDFTNYVVEQGPNVSTESETIVRTSGYLLPQHTCSDCRTNFFTKSDLLRHISSGTCNPKISLELSNVVIKKEANVDHTSFAVAFDNNKNNPGLGLDVDSGLEQPKSSWSLQQNQFCQNNKLKVEGFNDSNRKTECKLQMQRFSQNNLFFSSDLDVDVYSCNKETPYQCPECDVTFIQRDAFLSHCLTHTYRKPYTSEVCVSQIAERERMQAHYNSVLGEGKYVYEKSKESLPDEGNLKADQMLWTAETSCSNGDSLVLPLESDCPQ